MLLGSVIRDAEKNFAIFNAKLKSQVEHVGAEVGT